MPRSAWKSVEAVASAAQDVLGDEACCQHPRAALARNVVNAIPGEHEVASEEANAASRMDHAGTDDRSVLVAVTRKEVGAKLAH